MWLSVASGALLLVGTAWAIAADQSGSKLYTLPLVLALFLVPLIAALAIGARRFVRAPERVRAPLNVRLARGWTEANKSWRVVWQNRRLLPMTMLGTFLGAAFLAALNRRLDG